MVSKVHEIISQALHFTREIEASHNLCCLIILKTEVLTPSIFYNATACMLCKPYTRPNEQFTPSVLI